MTSSMAPDVPCCADYAMAGDRRHVATTRSIPCSREQSLTGECPHSGLSGFGLVRWGEGRPFVLSDARRRQGRGTVRMAENY